MDPKFLKFLKICEDVQEEHSFFLTNYFLSETNPVSPNQFFFELATTFFRPTRVRRNCWQMTNYMKIVVYRHNGLAKKGAWCKKCKGATI